MVYKMKLAEISEIELDDDSFRPRPMTFTKLHGNGNDFVLIDEVARELVAEEAKRNFAMHCCRRSFGIGADGILFLTSSSRATLGMRLFQPDGSEAEMCGNGIRCLAKYAWDAGYVGQSFDVETLAGIIPVQVREKENSFWAKVNMGVPKLDRPSIPACGSGEFISEEIEYCQVSAVNTGVPHAVIFVQDMQFDIKEMAPKIRHSSFFPEGANVNFVQVGSHFRIRTFERGVEGETQSCGTGAVASASIARHLGLVGDEVLVETKGGPLIITFEEGKAFMEGPAVTVYTGELSEEYHWSLSEEM
ncbi:Diaminopimelate epimerase [uncultured archaeon]|nr:Diaminopimelate epimerase [uncultured archaeon]